LDNDGTIRALGRCLDVANGALTNGTTVRVHHCNNAPAQQWALLPGGSLVNTHSGKCLDPGTSGSALTIQTCAGTPQQRWTPQVQQMSRGQVVGVQGRCLGLASSVDADGTAVDLRNCDGVNDQLVWFSAAGEIRLLTRCVDVTSSGTAAG